MIDIMLVLFPAIVLAGILFIAVKKSHPLLHLFIFVLLFIFTRDAMTPLGVWSIGGEGFLWIRFNASPWILLILGTSSLGIVFLMQRISTELAALTKWFEDRAVKGIFLGIVGAFVVVLPLVIYQGLTTPIEARGGRVDLGLLPFLLYIALSVNLYEEILFRGYLQGWLIKKEGISPFKAALLSGAFFSFGHLFLAYNVTQVGIPILIFTFWEGSIAGLVRNKYGVIPAAITHGLAIFFIVSGLF